MIRTDNRNSSVDDPGIVMRRKSLVECAGSVSADSDDAIRRGVTKSKSSGHIELPYSSEQSGEKGDGPVSLSPFRAGSRKPSRSHRRRDARTVKSEANYFSPRKPVRNLSFGQSEACAKQSPVSVSEIEAIISSPELAGSDKLSISFPERLSLQQSPHVEKTPRGALQNSSSFSEEETLDVSSGDDDLGSIPASFRLSCSNFSVPSDLSGSIPTLDFHYSPKNLDGSRRRLMLRPLAPEPTNSGGICPSVDCTPTRPSRRGSGDRTSSDMGESNGVGGVVPQQISCQPVVDALPSKPARRTSMSNGCDLERSMSTFNTSLTHDSAPMKPNRYRSGSTDEASHLYGSYSSSMDTSPLKPERQSSSRYLTAARLQRRMSPATGSGGGPPPLRRTVSRTDSLMAPSGGALGRLSISSRRHSISEDAPDLNRHSPALLARTFSGSGDIMQQLQQQQQQQSQPSIPRSGGPSGCPPRRSVSRSESMARPRMPTLVRRDSITAADENPMERIRRQSITLPIDSIQEAVAVTNSMD